MGYSVDVINWDDETFIPKKEYSFFIDIHSNLERITPLLAKDCIKILHITGTHWLFQNQAEYSRLLALQKRRKVTLMPRRIAKPSLGIEYADLATTTGNDFTIKTFSYANKPIYRIPISTSILYDFPENKDFASCKKNYLWFGGGGLVHKGLDLVLEAFAQMPEYQLTICGPVKGEKDFEKCYYKELYKTSNIKTLGWMNIYMPDFKKVLDDNLGVIYPSCSEGGGGSVITCLHAGLIPIVSYQSSVDVCDFGFMLKDCSINEIKNTIKKVSKLSINELRTRSKNAWDFARRNHTKERFAEEYRKFVEEKLILNK